MTKLVQKVSSYIICGKKQEYRFVTSDNLLYFGMINSVKGGKISEGNIFKKCMQSPSVNFFTYWKKLMNVNSRIFLGTFLYLVPFKSLFFEQIWPVWTLCNENSLSHWNVVVKVSRSYCFHTVYQLNNSKLSDPLPFL